MPCRASITAPAGICLSWVSGTSLPLIWISTTPWVGLTSNDLVTVGAPGAGAGGVVKVASGPNVVPALLVATSRTW